jgi:hypothetical protein
MRRHLFLVFLGGLSFPLAALPQGQLQPPPGTPGPTMKTLSQLDAKLEKRTPITSNGPAVNITSPGSYYLTKDSPFAGKGLVITVDKWAFIFTAT